MAAPRKPKTAGMRSGKSKAKASSNGFTETAAAAPTVKAPVPSAPLTTAPVANGNGGSAPSAEMIRLRAYEVFLSRDRSAGDELSDWLIAEREIMEKSAPHD